MLDKPTERKQLSKNVISYCQYGWQWFRKTEILSYEITGKYLFFSENKDLLIKVVIEELENGGFHLAKTNFDDEGLYAGEYVLCLYYKNDECKHELATKYRNKTGLRYRYWKSDEDTRQGKYSQVFLDKLLANQD
jgi:hypothetical protein